MGAGPVVASCGILLLLRTGLDTDYVTDLLPALLVFALGLSLTVAPLVATVLADADESDAGIASAINNAIARVAGLVGVSVVGVVVASDARRRHVRGQHGVGARLSRGRPDLRRSRCSRRHPRRDRHLQSAPDRSQALCRRSARRYARARGRLGDTICEDNRRATTAGGVMDDPQIHGTIEQLVAEEHELWQRESAGQPAKPTGEAARTQGLARPVLGPPAPTTRAARGWPGSGHRRSSRRKRRRELRAVGEPSPGCRTREFAFET